MFTFLRNPQPVSTAAAPFYIFTSNIRRFRFLHIFINACYPPSSFCFNDSSRCGCELAGRAHCCPHCGAAGALDPARWVVGPWEGSACGTRNCSPHLIQERPPHAPSDSELLTRKRVSLVHVFPQSSCSPPWFPWVKTALPGASSRGCRLHPGSCPTVATQTLTCWTGNGGPGRIPGSPVRLLPAGDLAQGTTGNTFCLLLFPHFPHCHSSRVAHCPSSSLWCFSSS